jgi:antirestriction protein ArdC
MESFIKSQGAKINHGGDRAFYHQGSDQINLPELSSFYRLSAYYGTAIHELVVGQRFFDGWLRLSNEDF